MKIECILRREGGTKADVGGMEYHFEPVADGAHVAEIENEAHIDRFLAIPEAYKVYHGKETPEGQPKPVAVNEPKPLPEKVEDAEAALAGSEELPPQFEIGGRVVTQLEAVKAAFEVSGLTSDEWNELDDADRAARIEIALDTLAEAADVAGEDTGVSVDEIEDRDALVAAYEAKFGKKPHHNAKIETIKAQLED